MLGPIVIGNERVMEVKAKVTIDIPDPCVTEGAPSRMINAGVNLSTVLYHQRMK
jgi:serine acetyltransferase